MSFLELVCRLQAKSDRSFFPVFRQEKILAPSCSTQICLLSQWKWNIVFVTWHLQKARSRVLWWGRRDTLYDDTRFVFLLVMCQGRIALLDLQATKEISPSKLDVAINHKSSNEFYLVSMQ